jgi:sugar-phosphatase
VKAFFNLARIMQNKIEAIIFDMDGLLIDSEPLWRKSEIKVFETVGLQLTDADCALTTGYRFDEVVKYWYAKHPWGGKSLSQIENEVLDEMELGISTNIEPIKGAIEIIKLAKAKGYKTAIASSSAIRLINACVKRLGVEDSLDILHSAEFCEYGKPHPQIFIDTAKLLGVSPYHCVVLEDSLNGVLAAKSAKMCCIAIPDQENKNNTKFVIANIVCKDLTEAMQYV